ncbi:MAG: signal peptidase II [Ardenticatenaceae bacterium]|nr:signal peptidase II [Ardenticatenaceae bacterium]
MIYLAMLLAFLADRLTKWWAADYLTEHGLTRVNEWLTFRTAYNRGISFGMFQGIGPAVGWITLLFLLGLFIYQMHLPKQAWLLRLGLAVLIGGAMGNLVDRIFVGEVLDFIQTPLRQGIFNVADMMIHLGMILVFLGVWQQERREKQQRRETADPA